MKGRIFVLTGESPEKPGGAEHLIRAMTAILEDRGYQVEVLHRGSISARGLLRRSGKWRAYLSDFVLSWYLGKEVSRRMSEDVVAILSHGPVGFCLPKMPPRVKKIHFYHGTYRGQAQAIAGLISCMGCWKLKWWDSMVLERWCGVGKLILCNSDQTRNEVLRFFGYHGITVLPPLDVQCFRPLDPLESREGLGLPKNKKIGIFVGSTEPTKGFPLVRRVMAALPEVQWILALRGSIPEDLKTARRIALYPNASPDLLARLYSAADFAICASRYEAFGYVVAEALACGTPVVASPGGASRLLLTDSPLRECLISQCDATDDFLSAIQRILKEPLHFRNLVIASIIPKLEERMTPHNWSTRFFKATGL